MKKLIGLLFMAALALGAAEQLHPSTPEDWLDGEKLLKGLPDGALTVSGGFPLISRALVKVDTKKRYQISGTFQVSKGKIDSTVFFGLICLDRYRRVIKPEYITFIPGTTTELVGDLPLAADSFYVKDASKWKTGGAIFVGFQVPEDGSAGKLPLRTVSEAYVKSVKPEGHVWKVELSGRAGIAMPSGTSVRLQESGPTYHYTGGSGNVGSAPVEFRGIISGIARTYDPGKFYPGTEYCRIVILPNFNQGNDTVLEIRNVELKEVPKEKRSQ